MKKFFKSYWALSMYNLGWYKKNWLRWSIFMIVVMLVEVIYFVLRYELIDFKELLNRKENKDINEENEA